VPSADATAFLIFIVTFIYAAVAILQLMAIRRQAKIAEDAIMQLERPWIRIRINDAEILDSLTAIGKKPDAPLHVFVKFSLENDGRSPALVWCASLNMKCIPDPESDEPPYGELDEFPPVPVSPSQRALAREEKGVLDPKDLIRIARGDGSLRFFCLVKYRDVLGPNGRGADHETRFSWGWRSIEADDEARAQGFHRRMQSLPMGGPNWTRYT